VHVRTALPPGRENFRKDCVGRGVEPRAGADTAGKIKVSVPVGNQTHILWSCSPCFNHYTQVFQNMPAKRISACMSACIPQVMTVRPEICKRSLLVRDPLFGEKCAAVVTLITATYLGLY
jgi:hypothetical protein